MLSNLRAVVLLLALLASVVCAQAYYDGPTLTLEGEAEMDGGIAELADYTRDREINGLGWKIASAVRADQTGAIDSIMRRGLTVILPDKGDPKPLKHCYVLAGFDLLPNEQLLVCIRDPEVYWEGYDYRRGLVDQIQLVWYDKDWNETWCMPLEYEVTDFPDDFRISEQELNLVAIRHPVREAGSEVLTQTGHALDTVRLKDGLISPVPLPEEDAYSTLPASWLPLKMRWDDNGWLLVQAGSSLRKYSLSW